MNLRVDFDQREFNEALSQYVELTSKDSVTAVNQKALDVAIKAYKYTEQASKEEIRQLTTQTWWWPMIVNRLKNAGIKATTTNKNKKARQIINAKLRSVTFIKSGWISAMKILSAAAGKTYGKQEKGKRPLGTATAARFSTTNDIQAEIINNAGNTKSRTSGQALLAQFPALQRAINDVTDDMREYIERKMEQRSRQFSAK